MITMVAPRLEGRLPDDLVRTRVALASDPECPAAVLEVMAYDTDKVVTAVIDNPGCTLTALRTAAWFRFGDYYWSPYRVLTAISRHPLLDVELLRSFALAHAELIVGHPLCPPDLLVRFAQSPEPFLREQALLATALPTEVLLESIGDHDARVVAATRNSVARHDHATIRRALLLMNPRGRRRMIRKLEPEEVELLVGDDEDKIRYAVALTTDDPQILRRLAADSHGRVRRAASNRVFAGLA